MIWCIYVNDYRYMTGYLCIIEYRCMIGCLYVNGYRYRTGCFGFIG